MKYIDLHLHLDGSIDLKIAKKLAKLQNIDLQDKSDEELEKIIHVPNECKSLVEFLKCFAFPLSLLQTKEALEEATYLILEQKKKEGNIYVELRYAPQLHCQKNMNQEDSIKAVLKGLKRSSLKANIILCLMKGENNQKENLETIELAKKYLVKDNGVVALDIAGAESLYQLNNYENLFILARQYNIPFTIHAGESSQSKEVKLAVNYGASRIGHGIKIYNDKEEMELVKEKQIPLELCPTSNLQTCACPSYEQYPLLDFLNYGIKVTINTDNPAIENTSIKKEFSLMKKYLHLTKTQELIIVNNAIDASFTTEDVKLKLKELIN